jgi:tripartite-type tricarboxylate transporter receptor subunit TctC
MRHALASAGALAASLVFALAFALTPELAAAQAWPARPIRIVVPSPAGGLTDLLARTLGQRMTPALGQPIVIENRAGGGQMIGAEAVARAAPDGYTLLVSDSSTFVINPHLYRKVPYDPVRDFKPLAMIGSNSPVIAVNAQLPVRTLAELVNWSRSHPDELRYGSMGNGSYAHIAMEQFKRVTGASVLHVPYKGAAPAVADLTAGHITTMLGNITTFDALASEGKLRLIASVTRKRLPTHADLPTADESGLPGLAGFEVSAWWGLLGPAGLPAEIIRRVNEVANQVLGQAEFRQGFLASNGMVPALMSPEAFARTLQADLRQWEKMVRDSGATVD